MREGRETIRRSPSRSFLSPHPNLGISSLRVPTRYIDRSHSIQGADRTDRPSPIASREPTPTSLDSRPHVLSSGLSARSPASFASLDQCMSWTHNLYSSRPSSRSPPRPIHPASHPHSNSRFRSSSPPAPTAPSRSAAHHERERERGPHPVAAVSAGGPIDRAPPPAESTRTSAGGGGDPATKQVDQIVQHFFSKTVAVISQTRVPPPHARERDSGAASNAHDASAAPASGATYAGDAPSLRRGDSSHSGGKRKGDKLNSWVRKPGLIFQKTRAEISLTRTHSSI